MIEELFGPGSEAVADEPTDDNRYAAFEALFGPTTNRGDDFESDEVADTEVEPEATVASELEGSLPIETVADVDEPQPAAADLESDPWNDLFENDEETTPSEIASAGPREDLHWDFAVGAGADEGFSLPPDADAIGKRIVEGLIKASDLIRSLGSPIIVAGSARDESITLVEPEAASEIESVCTPVASGDVVASLACGEDGSDADLETEAEAEAEVAVVDSTTKTR